MQLITVRFLQATGRFFSFSAHETCSWYVNELFEWRAAECTRCGRCVLHLECTFTGLSCFHLSFLRQSEYFLPHHANNGSVSFYRTSSLLIQLSSRARRRRSGKKRQSLHLLPCPEYAQSSHYFCANFKKKYRDLFCFLYFQ